jgi:hypothetical protein
MEPKEPGPGVVRNRDRGGRFWQESPKKARQEPKTKVNSDLQLPQLGELWCDEHFQG